MRYKRISVLRILQIEIMPVSVLVWLHQRTLAPNPLSVLLVLERPHQRLPQFPCDRELIMILVLSQTSLLITAVVFIDHLDSSGELSVLLQQMVSFQSAGLLVKQNMSSATLNQKFKLSTQERDYYESLSDLVYK